MKALLIGSISALADTSEVQRAAFNQAFTEVNLGWHWSRDMYRDMLSASGGKGRIGAFAKSKGVDVDAGAVHARKTAIFQEELRKGVVPVRAETAKILNEFRRNGAKIAFVSGTAKGSIEALLAGFGGAEEMGFDLVTSGADATVPKPDPALYEFALQGLAINPKDALAVEDNLAGVEAAKAAGIKTLVNPNANTKDHDFGDTPHITTWTASRAA